MSNNFRLFILPLVDGPLYASQLIYRHSQRLSLLLALIAVDAARPVSLVVAHSCLERTVDRNLKIVWSEAVTMCVGI